ncbi:protein-L-isoaspartate(D-aspartate) O-methyltransferase [Candidatus Neomarinimicrobiota bacterium]
MANLEKYRLEMVEDQICRRGISNPDVINAVKSVPRHLFIDEDQAPLAYIDSPLPIGYGQTISQPYIVAYMTEALKLKKNHSVLEIGTGCGYQAAILSLIVKEVVTIEYVAELAASAKKRLSTLGYSNIQVIQGNGTNGWPVNAPYDRIIGTAAPESLPQSLVEQLGAPGRMIIPVGKNVYDQSLYVITKTKNGKTHIKKSLPVRFVPMINGNETL